MRHVAEGLRLQERATCSSRFVKLRLRNCSVRGTTQILLNASLVR